MLDRIIEEKWLTADGVYGFFPANAVGDDIEVYTDDVPHRGAHHAAPPAPAGRPPRGRAQPVPGRLRRAARDRAARPRRRLRRDRRASGSQDRITAFKEDSDDYSAILLESLADRLAEAFAERLHQRVRTEFWGHVADEDLANEDLIAEKYDGIRPAPGYPACPEHTEKRTLWELLDVEAEHRHRADREHGHVARRRGVAAGTSRTRSRSTSSSAGSAATRSRTTPSARAGRSPRPSAGSRPTSATTRRTERVAHARRSRRRPVGHGRESGARSTTWPATRILTADGGLYQCL